MRDFLGLPSNRLCHFSITFILTLGAVLAVFLWQGRQGFSMADEGFLWYGAQRVIEGEVPLRDFQSYDPGRYYCSAAIMEVLGNNGIMTLRIACTIFQWMGLFLAVMLLVRSCKECSVFFWLLATIIFLLWMYPLYKSFDFSVSIALIGALSFLVQYPSLRRYFLTGVVVGIAAVFGRNHGMYGVAGSLGVMLYLAFGKENKRTFANNVLVWLAGVFTGYLPVLLMLLLVPGFAQAFWESIRFLTEVKTTNLYIPIPWPWHISLDQSLDSVIIRRILFGTFFIIILAYGVFGIVWAIWQKYLNRSPSPVVVASVFLSLPYAHYAYSRADYEHLALGIFPFLIGGFILLANQSKKIKWLLAILLFNASAIVIVPTYWGFLCPVTQQCVKAEVAGDTLNMAPNSASKLALLNRLSRQFTSSNRSFIAAPFLPGAYAVLGQKSPMWEIYNLFPRSVDFQRREIDRIKTAHPVFAIIYDCCVDEQNGLLYFHDTHPLIDKYIQDNFVRLDGYTNDPVDQIYVGKQAMPLDSDTIR